MKIYTKIDETIFNRPNSEDSNIKQEVSRIINQIKEEGDSALFSLIYNIDKYTIDSSTIIVSNKEFEDAELLLNQEFKDAIGVAKDNIIKFHSEQLREDIAVTTMVGVELKQRRVPINRVGLYIPSGTAPLFSTLLMCALPALIAGCRDIIVATPANNKGEIAPEVLYTAKVCGVNKIYKIGGAMAIAAMAYGTSSIPKVDKIFGPGNRYVTYAKQLVAVDSVAIDMPAGPSEVMVLGDDSARADYIAADLLSQLEHGSDSQAIAIVTTMELANAVADEIRGQLPLVGRQSILEKSLDNCIIIVEPSIDEMVKLANMYAAEHLIISLNNAEEIAYMIENAGSIFIGNYSPESVGDYASGTNHTLPTAGWANSYSGVNIDTFSKYITYQKLSYEGLKAISPTVMIMAEHEGLQAHKNAVKIRLKE